MAAVLNSVSGGGTTKTRIMYSAYLSYAQVKEYLEFMVKRGLLFEQDGMYGPTAKGLDLLRDIEGISDMLSLTKPTEALQTVSADSLQRTQLEY